MTTAIANIEVTPLRLLKPSENPAAVYLASLAPSGRRAVAHLLNVVAGLLSGGRHSVETLPWESLRYAHVQAVRANMPAGWKPATANLALAGVRGVLRAAWRLGLLSADNYARAVDVPRVRGDDTLDDSRAGRAIDFRECRALFAACDGTATGARDAALLALLWGGGLRRSEAAGLMLADVGEVGETLRLTVRGKGAKTRSVYLSGGAVEAVTAWLAVRGSEPGPLLLATRQGGAIERHGMSSQAIYQRLRTLARRADVEGFSPHDMRRTYVGDLLDSGVDLATVQAMAGHASPTTTSRYDRRPGETRRLAAMKRRTPYRASAKTP